MKRAGYVFRLSVTAVLVVGFYADTSFCADAELPKVLIIGDSISIGYTPYVKELLAGKAIVKHNPGNAEDTVKGLGELDEWLGAEEWDVIHFNWGLWDMRHDKGFDNLPRVPIAEYEKNLRQLVKRLKAYGAKLIWANTTPVPAQASRRIQGGESLLNEVARRIMVENGIAINDLNHVAASRIAEYQRKADVHFFPAGSEALGQAASVKIRPLLRWPRHTIDDSWRGADGVRLADVNDDGLMDIATGWEEGGLTRAYINPGHEKAKERWPAVTVGQTPSVEDAVFVDLDGDGAVDVVTCCEGKTRTLFVHWAPTEQSEYLNSAKWNRKAIGDSADKTAWMFCVPMQVDGAGGIDLVVGSKGGDGVIGWYESGAEAREVNDYKWHKISKADWIMSIVARDMDGDGDADVLVSDRKGDLRGVRWLENPGAGGKQKQAWENHFVGAQGWEVMFLKVYDFSKDGMDDILLAARQGKEVQRILRYRRLDKSGLRWKETELPFPENTGIAKAVAPGDIDLDGRDDIVFSCEAADKDKSGVMWMWQDDVTSEWHGFEISGPRGIKFDRLELADMDGDGDLDVLTCEERDKNSRGEKGGMGVFWYENLWGGR